MVLNGTSADADEGTYSNIRISVGDGSHHDSILEFTVQVTQISQGKVILPRSAPTQDSDSSPLTDLAGYGLYYGTNRGSHGEPITLDNPGIVTYVVENPAPNTHYFVATSYNSGSVERPFSRIAVKVVGQ